MKILITGGAGYIGTHTCVECMAAGYEPAVIDNYCNSAPEALACVEQIAGRPVTVMRGDVRDAAFLRRVFADHAFTAAVHFAGLKAVGESTSKPLAYYDTNVSGSLALVATMAEYGVKSLVFSSSATVYGDPQAVQIREDFPLSATNPYGRSKLMVEEILRDVQRADPDWRIMLLRYFNPVGAHPSGLICEDP